MASLTVYAYALVFEGAKNGNTKGRFSLVAGAISAAFLCIATLGLFAEHSSTMVVTTLLIVSAISFFMFNEGAVGSGLAPSSTRIISLIYLLTFAYSIYAADNVGFQVADNEIRGDWASLLGTELD